MDEKAAGLASKVERVAPAVYAVPSLTRQEEIHLVTDLDRLFPGSGRGLACDCEAAGHGKGCSHRAAVVARRQRQRGAER